MSAMIRPAVSGDFRLIAELIYELAEYDRLGHAVRFENASLREYLFGPRPVAEVLIAEVDDDPQGFALFYYNFSTFEGRPGLYLEDLFVRPQARGRGLGKALLVRLAELAVERGCSRLQWSVLDWNDPAITFYGRLGAKPVEGWTVMRMEGAALAALGDGLTVKAEIRSMSALAGVISAGARQSCAIPARSCAGARIAWRTVQQNLI